uniref:Ig-like domain-containing protein n=1 Tax=Dicentrarchus labrax TaxID=13489 RepID=A0A8P4G896_DICLA
MGKESRAKLDCRRGGIPSWLVSLFTAFHVLAADVPFRLSALTRSCVVIPCSFQFQEDVPLTRGICRVLDHFKGRTKILGELSEGNCTLEIDDIKPFDNGPFCFHAEKGNDKYRFNNSCVFIVMKGLESIPSPEKPVMTSVPAEVDAGSTITVSCSVMHTCPSHPPVLSWSVPSLTSEVIHTSMQQGIWQTTSTISFMVAGGDGVKNLTCTAISWRGKQQANTVKLTVKGAENYNHIIIPTVVGIGTAVLFGVFCILMVKKYNDMNFYPRFPPPKSQPKSCNYNEDLDDGDDYMNTVELNIYGNI